MKLELGAAKKLEMTFRDQVYADFQLLATPNVDNSKYATLFEKMEDFDISPDVIRKSHLHKCMEDVIPLIPAESEFHLKARAQGLLEKWVALLNVPVIPFDGQTKPLPFEVLRSIMACNIEYSQARIVTRNRDLQYDNWRKEIDDILACLFVAKAWSLAAKDILYRGKIYLQTLDDVTLFHRTVQEDSEVPCTVRHLHFVNLDQDSNRYQFRKIASSIVTQCTHIKILEAEADSLSFSSVTELPVLWNLRQFRADYQGLDDVAPLLSRSPNLETLEARHLYDPLYNPDFSTIDNFPRPTFHLRRLRLCQCSINMAQYRWLLSSSNSIESLEMEGIAGAVADVIHDSVCSLYIEAHPGDSRNDSRRMNEILPSFRNLTSLRIGGADLPWDSVFDSIAAPLRSITMPYSKGAICLRSKLTNPSWLPKLESVTMYHHLNCGEVDRSSNDQRYLKSACENRCVELKWITLRRGDWSETDYRYMWSYKDYE